MKLRWWWLLACGNDAFKSIPVSVCVSYIYTVTYNVFNEFNYHVAKPLKIRFRKQILFIYPVLEMDFLQAMDYVLIVVLALTYTHMI